MPRREQIDSPPSSPEVTPAAGTASNGIDKKKNPTSVAPAIATSTSPTPISTPSSREALLGRIARFVFVDQTLPVGTSSGESTAAGQDSTFPAAPPPPSATTSVILEEEMPPRPVLVEVGLSSTDTTHNRPMSSTSSTSNAPTHRAATPPTTSSTIIDPFRPRHSERHHLAVAMDLLDELFNDDDDDFDDEDMDDFDIPAAGAHAQGARASTDGVSDAPSQ